MIRSRHELKYVITEAQAVAIAERIRPFMRPDRHSRTGWYSLVSLYLDSPDLRLCRESLEGVKNRFKLRIRSYSDEADAPCFFEIKRRINQVIVKSRAVVPRGIVASLLAHKTRPSSLDADTCRNLEQFLYYRQWVCADPVIRVRYVRQAFESRCDDDVRVTFDRHLSLNITRTPELGLNGSGWQRPPERGVVLEIKFTRGYPAWVGRLVRDLGLRTQSMSKYARLVAQACSMRLYAPVAQHASIPEPVMTSSRRQRGCAERSCVASRGPLAALRADTGVLGDAWASAPTDLPPHHDGGLEWVGQRGGT